MSDEPKDYNNRWRFTKDVPLSVVAAFIMQTTLLIWFLAGQNAALNSVIKAVSENQLSAYTKEDARHEREFIDQRFLNQAGKIDELTRRIAIIESQTQGKR